MTQSAAYRLVLVGFTTCFLCCVLLYYRQYVVDQDAIIDDIQQARSLSPSSEYNGMPIQVIPPSSLTSDHPTSSHANPTVACLVLTSPTNWTTRGQAVLNTWLPRCDHHTLMYAVLNQTSIDYAKTIPVNVTEGRNHLAAKTWAGLVSMYNKLADSVDWYYKADDDTYLVVENLRALLAKYNPQEPHYIGFKWTSHNPKGYIAGGPGYALSHAAVRRLVREGYYDNDTCLKDGECEDVKIGACLAKFGIYPEFAKDESGKLLFHHGDPIKLLENGHYKEMLYHKEGTGYTVGTKRGYNVMSPHLISFHYMEPAHIYMYDYLLYDVQRSTEHIKSGTD